MERCDPYDLEGMVDVQWPSVAEGQRYQGVLYIEKEGFDPQLREARIADQFDIAILSCKGHSVTAGRMCADHVCRMGGGVPLVTMHDMDKAGFLIAERLTTISDHARDNDLVKYEFQNEINVTDLGLRLTDVRRYNLKSERCVFRGYFDWDTTATPEEQEFLRSGKRVELNAFTAPQFIEWTVAKLKKHFGPKRFIPTDEVLADAYRRAVVAHEINKAIVSVRKEAIEKARIAAIPKSLRRELSKRLSPESGAWDEVLYELVANAPDRG
jgi:hypothetical protein